MPAASVGERHQDSAASDGPEGLVFIVAVLSFTFLTFVGMDLTVAFFLVVDCALQHPMPAHVIVIPAHRH